MEDRLTRAPREEPGCWTLISLDCPVGDPGVVVADLIDAYKFILTNFLPAEMIGGADIGANNRCKTELSHSRCEGKVSDLTKRQVSF
jgi:hypothetical protein